MNGGEKKKGNKINKLMESLKTVKKKIQVKINPPALSWLQKFPQSIKYLLKWVHQLWMSI